MSAKEVSGKAHSAWGAFVHANGSTVQLLGMERAATRGRAQAAFQPELVEAFSPQTESSIRKFANRPGSVQKINTKL